MLHQLGLYYHLVIPRLCNADILYKNPGQLRSFGTLWLPYLPTVAKNFFDTPNQMLLSWLFKNGLLLRGWGLVDFRHVFE